MTGIRWTAAWILMVGAVLPLVGTGCKQMEAQQPTELQQEAAAIRSVTPVRSDAEIKAEIRRLIARDRELAAELITYEVEDGVVTLEGTVSDSMLTTRAETIVRSVIGVHRVVNRLDTL